MSIAIGQDGKPKLCVGQLPGRSRPSLYLWEPMCITTLASFRNEWAAERAISFLEGMVGARVVDGDASPGARP